MKAALSAFSGDVSAKVRRKSVRLSRACRSVSAPPKQAPSTQEPKSKQAALLSPNQASKGKITIMTSVFDPLSGPITSVFSPGFNPPVGLTSADSREQSRGVGSGTSGRGVQVESACAKHAIGTDT